MQLIGLLPCLKRFVLGIQKFRLKRRLIKTKNGISIYLEFKARWFNLSRFKQLVFLISAFVRTFSFKFCYNFDLKSNTLRNVIFMKIYILKLKIKSLL